jgi:beta-galactosidase
MPAWCSRPALLRIVMAALVSYMPLATTLWGTEALGDFHLGWKFAHGEQAGAERPDLDDADWKAVDLPHDWAIAGPFGAPEENGDTGKLPWRGEGWYRKEFVLPAAAAGERLQFVFDGVMSSPTVYLNGNKVGSWLYGYNSFVIDATDAAIFGGNNVLAVHADTRAHGSRWYPGAGIYRKATARLVGPVHIPVWGVFVTTPELRDVRATVRIEVEVANTLPESWKVTVETRIIDPSGREVAKGESNASISSRANGKVPITLTLENPQRWDVDHPHLYTAQTRVRLGEWELDRAATTFGVRTFQWTANDGFHLNGRRVQLHGVNLHHDHGPLGAAFFPRAMERQLEIMKEMGVNAIRTSHNAPAPELLELCDRMGLVVFNELFDKYGPTAGIDCDGDTFVNQHAEPEVRNFVLRDRNHPCVVAWSIGNEIPGLTKRQVDTMAAYFRKFDTTRPTGIGSHIPAQASQGLLTSLDFTGWNYNSKYLVARKAMPDKPLVYSETASAFATRGAYKPDLPGGKQDWGTDGELNAYVLTAASWSDIPEHEFERMRKDRYVAGEFVWTGFDYLGEPTPFNGRGWKERDGRQARSSYFGIVDLAGHPKDSYYLYRSHWRPDAATVHLSPHWNWEGHEGKPVPVIVYTNGDEAELFLNGRSLGRRKKSDPDSPATDNLAYNRPAAASSEEHKQDDKGNVLAENLASKACDGDAATRWCAAAGTLPQHWQVDLGRETTARFVRITWEKKPSVYQFELGISKDGKTWINPAAKHESKGNASELTFDPQSFQHLRVTITGIKTKETWASIREVEVLKQAAAAANPYYRIVDAYRLRWLEVPYEPGELKAVAYKDGRPIGEALVRTAGKPARIRLTADRSDLAADGMDLSYVAIEMLDADGNLCPRAMDMLRFEIDGPAELKGVANGDPMGLDSFTDDKHPLFYGKAVAVLRSLPGHSGAVTLKVTAGDMQATTRLTTKSP